MAVQKYKSRVSETRIFNNKFCLVHLELVEPHRIEFEAGQHVMLSVPGKEQKWSYSVTSKPEMDHAVELVVDVSPGGPGTTYLKELKPGDEVEFMGPAGVFLVKSEDKEAEERLAFIATGSGIAPIRSMILDLLETKRDSRKMSLYWGQRLVTDMFWEEDFHQLAKEFDNFDVDIVLSRPPKEWRLCSGHVGDCVAGHVSDYTKTGYYLCGNKSMIEEMTSFLESKGVAKERVHHEKFY